MPHGPGRQHAAAASSPSDRPSWARNRRAAAAAAAAAPCAVSQGVEDRCGPEGAPRRHPPAGGSGGAMSAMHALPRRPPCVAVVALRGRHWASNTAVNCKHLQCEVGGAPMPGADEIEIVALRARSVPTTGWGSRVQPRDSRKRRGRACMAFMHDRAAMDTLGECAVTWLGGLRWRGAGANDAWHARPRLHAAPERCRPHS